VIPAVPVPLVATVFVREPARAWSELELKAAVLRLTEQLEARGAHVYVPRGDQDYAIAVGLRMLTLRRLVEDTEGLYRARPEELPLLSYYANSIAHLFP
jgi:glycerol-3-phosphate O-acyltransferase